MTNNIAVPTELADIYKMLCESHEINEKDLLAWNTACNNFFQNATTEEQLWELIKHSVIYRGVAAGTIHADCFKTCQMRLIVRLSLKIPNCTTIDEIRGVTQKLSEVYEVGTHCEPGSAQFDTIQSACHKWFELCTSKSEMVEMMQITHNLANVYDYI
jgi:hypothetical protein